VKVRYANDLLLTDLARRITNEWADINAMLTRGDHDAAAKRAWQMDMDILGFRRRLDDIRFPDEVDPGR
jgi:hypothetical protein